MAVSLRERTLKILNYETTENMPVVHFGYWDETLVKWRDEGHISADMQSHWHDGSEWDRELTAQLGFDYNWWSSTYTNCGLNPGFEHKVIKEFPDGSRHIVNHHGMVILQKPDAGSIPAEIDHLLKDRAAWEEHYKWRVQYSPDRVLNTAPWPDGYFRGVFCGSLLGEIRNWVGVEGLSYLMADDMDLFEEIAAAIGDLCYKVVEEALKRGPFEYGHFWEDICFKNGPLISPKVFDRVIGPHYKKITDLLKANGVTLASLDCDGKIDALIPTWIENGVNIMFPIEVGTWEASIAPWREKYGREIRGVGGMDKRVFAKDKKAVDEEIERLKPLVDLGGYIPCPDHRIAPDSEWDLVCYYTERFRKAFK